MDARSRSAQRRVIALGSAALVLAALGGIRVLQFRSDPGVAFLTSEAGSQWIQLDTDFVTQGHPPRTAVAYLRHRFDTEATIEEA